MSMKKRVSILLMILMLVGFVSPAYANSKVDVSQETNALANYLMNKVPDPGFGTMAGEWTVLALARSEAQLPQNYLDDYYKKVEKVVQEKKGALSSSKYTEYSRLIVALTSIGKDVTNVGGYNLLTPLGDFSKVIRQGINGPIWALIALDTKGFEVAQIDNPANQNSRDRMINEILSREIQGGGWSLMGDKADPDITAMALYSLVPYLSKPEVKAAVDRAVNVLSQEQLSSGGYITMNAENSESSAQVIIALSALGIDPMTDTRFIKTDASGQQHSVVDAFLKFKSSDGGFKHVADEGQANGMGTDQALEALVAVKRFKEGKARLFDMSDVGVKPKEPQVNVGGFVDIADSWAKDYIVNSKGFGIANGSNEFQPNKPITRGEFAVGIVNGMNLSMGQKQINFTDVKDSDWFSQAVKIASSQGIINGIGENKFDPMANITRQEAMAMIHRVLHSKGMNTEVSPTQIGMVLRGFKDGNSVSPWARPAVVYNIEKKIIEGRPEGIVPLDNIRRAEAVKVIELTKAVK